MGAAKGRERTSRPSRHPCVAPKAVWYQSQKNEDYLKGLITGKSAQYVRSPGIPRTSAGIRRRNARTVPRLDTPKKIAGVQVVAKREKGHSKSVDHPADVVKSALILLETQTPCRPTMTHQRRT